MRFCLNGRDSDSKSLTTTIVCRAALNIDDPLRARPRRAVAACLGTDTMPTTVFFVN